ncbi:MAG: aminoglycoside phosphotransferase family protein [Burkholderiaceae bacterium]
MAQDCAPTPDESLVDTLLGAGLIESPRNTQFTALSGGVSSDIWLVRSGARSFCVKRALARLKVAAEWLAPIERNRYEVAWLRKVRTIVPEAVPEVIWHDEHAMILVMEWLAPDQHALWKSELRDGRVDAGVAAQVGDRLGRIHAATADDRSLDAVFPPNEIFHAIRLEPYLEATALRHPDLQDRLFALSVRTGAQRRAMIHGDISPKNILVGANGPVFLDAECACIGDPAFDLAFCLNHLMLKCLWCPPAAEALLAAFSTLTEAYFARLSWESRDALEARVASLLPGLFLARVDGKSPAEYLTPGQDRDRVRAVARALLFSPPPTLAAVAAAWRARLHRDGFAVRAQA